MSRCHSEAKPKNLFFRCDGLRCFAALSMTASETSHNKRKDERYSA